MAAMKTKSESRRGWALAGAGLMLIAACAQETGPVAGEIALNDLFEADFELIDMHGEPASDERFEGRPALIYFGFASCPDVCPAALSVMTATLDELEGDAARIQPIFITVDPERDTPERLARFLAFDDRILGLTGSQEDIDAARDGLKVFAAKVPLKDSAMVYTMDHQSMFYLIGADGDAIVALDDNMAPETMARVIEKHV